VVTAPAPSCACQEKGRLSFAAIGRRVLSAAPDHPVRTASATLCMPHQVTRSASLALVAIEATHNSRGPTISTPSATLGVPHQVTRSGSLAAIEATHLRQSTTVAGALPFSPATSAVRLLETKPGQRACSTLVPEKRMYLWAMSRMTSEESPWLKRRM
jgi:hypothetical protein